MFDTLTDRLDGTFKKLRSRGKLHPKQVDNALTDMRTALLEADVSVDVADDFLERVRVRALSEEVMKSLTPGQQVVKVVNEELTVTMGGEHVALRPRQHPSRRHPDGRRPGLGQDHRLREAGPLPQAEGQAAPAGGRGPGAPGGRRAAADAGTRDRRPGVVRGPRPREAGEALAEGGRAPERRRGHRRHGGAPARRPRDDEAGPPDQGGHEAAPRPDGVRRHDRPGRRQPGARVHARGRHDRASSSRSSTATRAAAPRSRSRPPPAGRSTSWARGRSPRTWSRSTPTAWRGGSWAWATS